MNALQLITKADRKKCYQINACTSPLVACSHWLHKILVQYKLFYINIIKDSNIQRFKAKYTYESCSIGLLYPLV